MNKEKTKFTNGDIMKNFIMHESGSWDNAWVVCINVNKDKATIYNIGLSSTITIDNKFAKGTFTYKQ